MKTALYLVLIVVRLLFFSLVFLFSEFENLAFGVLDECYSEDEVLAEMLVEREIPKWGGMCALNLAAAAHAERFLAHPCCQSSLNSIWKSRGMPGVPYWKVCCKYGGVFNVDYDQCCYFQRILKRSYSTSKCKITSFDRQWVACDIFFCPFQVVLALICPLMIHKIVFYDEENHRWSVPLWKKLVIFYNAPISKFWAHLVSKKDF